METDNSKPLSARQKADIARLEAMPDEAIDTADIPEVTDWSDAVRGPIYNARALRETILASRAKTVRARLPSFDQLLFPTVVALRALGGSANVKELSDKIALDLQLPEEILGFRRPTASMNEVPYRAAWARTYLKRRGYVENTARGVWTLTQLGRDALPADIAQVPRDVRRLSAAGSLDTPKTEAEAEIASEESWKARLLESIGRMSPPAFERLAQRLLRESGFVKVEVTGRSGDQGVDGVGVLRIQLLSFHVLFQCKRYKDTVGASSIRDFRGAMVGRSDKGLFITTGRFTREARGEATRDGAPPIELIDGEDLCDLLKDRRIGVSVETVERVVILADVLAAI